MKNYNDFLNEIKDKNISEEIASSVDGMTVNNLTISEDEWSILTKLIFNTTNVMLKHYHQWLHAEETL